jgi:excisionase family DNA binding protein
MVEHRTPELLTVEDVCAVLQHSRTTVYRKIAEGQLGAYRLAEGQGPRDRRLA